MQILQEQKQKNETQHNKVPENRKRISANPLNGRGTGRKTAADQKGFTLPELLLVVGILVILAAVSIPAIIKHRDNLRQTELDEKARAVFIAAQNRLSILKTTGAVLEGTPEIPEAQIPSDYDASKGGVTPKNYILVNSSSESYFMSDTAYSASALLNGSAKYVVEYNPETYSAYGAWYWEKKGAAFQKSSSYDYDESNINSAKDSSGKEYNDLRSNKASRMAVSVGYYGGTVSIQQTATEEFGFSVKILNEAELKLQITPNDPLTFNKAAFKIIIAQKNGTKKYYMTADGATGKVTRDDKSNVYSDSSNSSFLITLDSLEANKHFANQFPDITAGDDLSIQVTGSGSGTKSGTSEAVIYSPTTRIVETNSLFAGVLTHESRTVSGAAVQLTAASIANGRHLQNLSPEISHVGFSGTSSSETAGNVKITNAKLTEDIDWKQYKFSDGSTYDFNEKCTSYKDSDNEKRHFYPIGNSTGNLVTIDGNEKQIKNLYVSDYELSADDKYGYAGLAGYLKPVDVDGKSLKPELKNIVLINPDICPTKKNLSITAYSGSLAGYLDNASVKNCQSYLEADSAITDRTNQAAYLSALYEGGPYNSETLHSGVISDSEYAGGLIGTASSLTADNSFASIKVSASSSGESYAGGLIGWVTGTGNTVSLCYVGGHTEKGVYVSSKPNVTARECAGGFVGKAEESTITKAFSTASVSYTGNGVCGSFMGSGDTTTVGGITYAYGIGTAFIPSGAGEDTINIARYADIAVESGDSSKMLNAAATDSYDIFLLGASAEKQLPYPCRTWLSSFHGDWGELKADLVYYEKYVDNSYGYWTANQDSSKGIVLNSLEETKGIVSDGYAVLSKNVEDSYTTKVIDKTVESSASLYNPGSTVSVAFSGNTYYLHMLPWKAEEKTFEKFSQQAGVLTGNKNTIFYDRLTVTLGGMSYWTYYNPHFAKAIASDDDAKKLEQNPADSTVNPKTAYIRTARHLYELGYGETIGTEDISNKGYWNNNVWTYVQAHDIDYKTYQATTYQDKPASMPQGIIGNYYYADNSGTGTNKFYGFASSYDGGNYKISNLTVSANSIKTFYEESSLFGNLSENSVVKDFTLLNPVFTGKNLVQALVVTNYGIISNVNIINPVITATFGAAAGLVNANETTGKISGCNIYPQQNTGEFSDIYSGDTLTVSNYTNAAITGTKKASGLVDSNSGNITNCAVSAAVTGGAANTNGKVSIQAPPSGTVPSASGFVGSMNMGKIESCYSNCYTAGVSACGFAYEVKSGASIKNCYALRKIIATGTLEPCGFARSNEGTISSCYTAASVGFLTSGNSYSFTIGGVLQPSVDYSKTTAYNFCPNGTTDCYYLNWGENPQHTGTGDNAAAITYDKLTSQAIGSLTIPATKEGSYPYERNLNVPEKGTYPFPIATGMKQYGDWPVVTETTEFKVKLAYFEIYQEAGKYTLGLYIKKPDETESLNTLRDDKEVFSDGYCLLIGKGYSDQQKSQNEAFGTLLSGGLSKGGQAYVSWDKNGKQTGKNSTNSQDEKDALLKISDMKINQADTVSPEFLYYYDNEKAQKKFTVNAGGDDYSLSLSDDTYYFRMLPFYAVVNNVNTDSSTYPYQPLTFHNGKGNSSDDASFYFTPAFAKSTIYSGGQTPSGIKQFSIRTARQLATLSAMYNKTYSQKLDNITYKQDRNINMAKYSYAYGDQMFADSDNQQLRWYRTEIGDESSTENSIAFDDIYDGNSKTISGLGSGGLTEETSNLDYPLFSYAAGGTIQNLTIEDSDFKGSGAKSALCGIAENETIKNITIKHVSLNAEDSNVNAGLLVGTVQGDKTVISGCAVTKNDSGNSVMTGTAAGMGGAIGAYSSTSTGSSITELAVDYLDMKTDTVSKIGGVIGSLDKVGILNISKAENITITAASAYIGGVIGYMDRSDQNVSLPSVKKITATDSSSTGAVGGAIGNWTGSASMTSLTVSDSTITGGNNVGGIIGLVSDGSVAQNLTASGVLVSGTSASANVGGAIGELYGGLSNVEVKASTNVRGAGNLGGAVGKVLNSDKQRNGVRVSDTTLSGDSASTIGGAIGDIVDCSSSSITGFSVEASVKIQSDNGKGTNTGGFVGLMEKGTVTNSYSAASVLVNTISNSSIATNAGGFVGTLKGGTIEKCYASGEVKGSVYSNIGGFFGLIPNGASKPHIYDCYATGNVTLGTYAAGTVSTAPVPSEGGFGGSIKTSSTDGAEIKRCYSLGLVTQPKVSVTIEDKEYEVAKFADAGGFIGQMKEIQQDRILRNLLDCLENIKLYNRTTSSKQYGLSIIPYLEPPKATRQIDSYTQGFTDNGDGVHNGNGPVTDDILGYPGYVDAVKTLAEAKSGKWENVALKNSYYLYRYYVFPIIHRDEYFNILAGTQPEKPDNSAAYTNRALDSTGNLNSGYLNTVYKYIQQSGMFKLWFIKGYYIYWSDSDSENTTSGYRATINWDDFSFSDIRTCTISVGKMSTNPQAKIHSPYFDYINGVLTRTSYPTLTPVTVSNTAMAASCSIANCYYLREAGNEIGLPAYNSEFTENEAKDLGILPWTVADFSKELNAEYLGNNTAKLSVMKGASENTGINYKGYPYPMIAAVGKGITDFQHAGSWPSDYHPLLTTQ